MLIPREKRGNEEFDGEEFLTRKSDEKNEELTSLKCAKNGKIFYILMIFEKKNSKKLLSQKN